MKQVAMLNQYKKSYGGELLKRRSGRVHGRPLSSKQTMHLVLRSTKAKGPWSFKSTKNERRIRQIIGRFSLKYNVKILSIANVGNHLHLHIKLCHVRVYRPFIRAITSSIMMAITGLNRWTRQNPNLRQKEVLDGHFWDYRPFSRVVFGLRGFLNLKDYIRINQLEGFGYSRGLAKWIVKSGFKGRDNFAEFGNSS